MNRKAIALMSGGLDSSLAVRLISDMGIDIIGVHFTGPFCLCNRGKGGLVSPKQGVNQPSPGFGLARRGVGGCVSYARKQADALGIPFSTIPLGQEYIDIVVNPKHGYGSGVNPCIDCRILMLGKARELMKKESASFVITGEVLGQRPMSQMKEKLLIIERESGLEGRIVRPLCGQHMPETIPEKEGLIHRDKLLTISGRSRREQMALAKMLEIGDYPCPAGGCLLTDKNFARRVKDAIAHEGLRLEDIALLKVGRHFRLPTGAKLVVGRNKEENELIEKLARDSDMVMVPGIVKGPSAVLMKKNLTQEEINIAAGITASYCDGQGTVTITCLAGGQTKTLDSKRVDRLSWENMRI